MNTQQQHIQFKKRLCPSFAVWALLCCLLFNANIMFAQNPYTGGNSGAQSLALGNFSTCTLIISNVGIGGNDDGHCLSSPAISVVCNSNIYVGGNAGGQSLAVGNFATCTLPLSNVGIGGNDDGYCLSAPAVSVICNSNIYAGGNAGGQSLALGSFAICSSPLANIGIGGISDGHSQDTSGCVVLLNPCTMVPSAGTGTAICYLESTPLSASVTNAVGTPTFSWSPNLWLSNANIANPIATPLTTTTYTVYITDNICTQAATVTITVNPLPAANTGTNTAICNGQSTTIGAAAVAGNTYSWASVPIGFSSSVANPSVNPITTTTYTLIETVTATGCSKSNSVTITVNPLPLASTGADIYVCSGNSASIGAAAVVGNTYLWSPSVELSSAIISQPTVTPTATRTYTLTERITATGCQQTNNVTVNYIAPATISGTLTTCSLQNTTLTASGGGPTPTYAWVSSPAGSYPTTAAITVNPATTTNYTVTITDAYCVSTANVTVTVNPLPSADAGANRSICYGANTNLGAVSVAGSTYLWTPTTSLSSTTVANPTATALTSTRTYTMTETITATGCQKSNSVTVTVYPQTAITGGGVTTCPGNSVTLVANGGSGVTPTYAWSSAPAGSYPTTQSITLSPTVTTTYTLTLTDATCGTTTANTTVTYVTPCVQQNVFTGGTDDGHTLGALTTNICNPNVLYTGGNAGGQSLALGNFATCILPLANTGIGGTDDGHSYSAYTNPACNTANLYTGGSAGGQSLALGNFATCILPLANTGTGGTDDGHSYSAYTNVTCSTVNLYTGGNSGGQSLVLGNFATCILPLANTGTGGIEDGSSGFTTGFPIGGCPIALPIELINFTATLTTDKKVRCAWQTASEVNNNYFTVEKTKDAINYTVVGKVKGAGNSTQILDYALMDEEPYRGTSYYRLKQTDYDGRFQYSQLEVITLLSSGLIISAYPNPVTEELTIKTFTEEEFTANIEITDVLGRRLFYKTQVFEKNNTTGDKLFINTAAFAEGIYLLNIRDASSSETIYIQRVVKIRDKY